MSMDYYLGQQWQILKENWGRFFYKYETLNSLITASFLGCVLYTGTLFTGLVTQTTYDVNK